MRFILPVCPQHPEYNGVRTPRTKKPCNCWPLHTFVHQYVLPALHAEKFDVYCMGKQVVLEDR